VDLRLSVAHISSPSTGLSECGTVDGKDADDAHQRHGVQAGIAFIAITRFLFPNPKANDSEK
jgi:hypothetical protein